MDYIFQSERLGFRNWTAADLESLAALNADPEVMAFFPSLKTKEESREILERLKASFLANKYTYFAVETVENKDFIGFIGLLQQTFEAEFTPCIDIGWRLKKSVWNKGYAVEGAKRCLEYAFESLDLEKIYAMAPVVNVKSERVMQKIGMVKVGNFQHSALQNTPYLSDCVLYEVSNS